MQWLGRELYIYIYQYSFKFCRDEAVETVDRSDEEYAL